MTGDNTCSFVLCGRIARHLHMEGGTMPPVYEEEWK